MIGFVGLSLLMLLANLSMTVGAQAWYVGQAQPGWAMPIRLLRIVWGIVYPLAGVAAWLVWRRIDIGIERKRAALRLWGWVLLFAALWPPCFFAMHGPDLGAAVLAPLLVATALTVRAFHRLQRAGALLLLPFAAWAVYAACLDAGFWWLGGV